jgi:cell surface protein SprA
LKHYSSYSIVFLTAIIGWLFFVAPVQAQQKDSVDIKKDTLRFPISDRRGDRFTYQNKNPFDIKDTALIKQKIEYDPATNTYVIVEKIGNTIYRKPTTLTFEQYYALQNKLNEEAYFKERANALTQLNQKQQRPKLTVFNSLFDRIFGAKDLLGGAGAKLDSLKSGVKNAKNNALNVDIKPQGSVDIMAGYQGQKTLNPTLPEAARKNGGFDFNMNTNFNVNANIGDKLKLPISYNTLANFDYLNQLKLDYKGKDDEIIKSIEAGNMSWQSKSTLVPSSQNLFGLKTQLQFGKLFITAAIATQRSQRQSQTLKGGAASTTFQKKLDDYEENRHFLMGQYFRNNYNTTMSKLPFVNSQVQIQRIEVWVTNRTGATTDARDIVGLMDLGENQPYNPVNSSLTSSTLPANGANNLYSFLTGDPNNRNPSQINSRLIARGLTPVNDFEKTFARKLTTNEYTFNPQAGFLSLNSQLQPDEVLAVAYQYTNNGRVYQVGEFSQDVALDTNANTSGVQKVLFLKLLKATSARTTLPIWKLMMKNVYGLDVFGLSKDGFQLNVLYQEPSGGLKRYLPEAAPSVDGKSLLNILGLDRLNSRNDPQPDGIYDYVEGYTVLSQQGKIVFPVLEPFGSDLARLAFNGQPALQQKYVYQQLYDSIKAIAQTYANLNRFVMQGQAKGSGGSEIYLGAFNIPQGSVKVTAGGQNLIEGLDYSIDYNLGQVKILNQAILNSGVPVNVSYENNAQFGLQQRGFLGLRADYKASKKLQFGASMERLNERPFFTKVNIGEDPIRNTMYTADVSYKSDLPGLTRLLDKLPFYTTKTMSTITAYGEGAYLKPGHPAQIGSGNSGLFYIDDFEGTSSSLDLRFPLVAWALASTPQGSTSFPEATLTDSVDYGKNRAKLAWYNIEPTLQDKNSTNSPFRNNLDEISKPSTRLVYTSELFPQQTTNITNTQQVTFDLAYYPTDLGPYNFETNPSQIDGNGKLKNPRTRWGGIMRSIDQTDFETNNIENIEFWVQDPFIKNPSSTGGKLRINLGNISEDILKDGKRFYENGLNTPTSPAAVDSSNTWGKTPVNPIQVTQAFSNNVDDRAYQDVGFDGLDNDGERRKRAFYLNQISNNFGTNSTLYQRAIKDPSNDDYAWYRDPAFDAAKTGILGRYKNYNNPQGNSPIATTSSQFSSAATLYPDNEDLNRDNTLNETEEYYEYEFDLRPGMAAGVTPYITDSKVVNVTYANGTSGSETWYLFRVPVKSYTRKIGQIPDFKSIRFVRMYLTDFEDSTVLRFAKLDLVRNQWRGFTYNLDTTGSYTPVNTSTTYFNTLAVNLEENSSRTPVNYVIPPGIERVQVLSNNGVNLLQNEQSLSMQIQNLADGDARAVFKTVNLDLRQYGTLSMFTHAESVPKFAPVTDNQLNLVVRIGQDFLNNYYEIKIPLKITPSGNYSKADAIKVWPAENNLDFSLQELVNLKQRRNGSRTNVTDIYRELLGTKTFSVLGNPSLGEVTGILVGVENAKDGNTAPLSTEVWINELRLSSANEDGSYAAVGRVDMQLADLGRLTVSGNMHTAGWGSIEQKIGERAQETMTQFDAALNIDAGKLVPKAARLSIPIYASINKTVKTPKYDPFEDDILLKDKITQAKTKAEKDSIKNAALDQTTIKTLNFTNVRVMPKGKPKILSISNFDVSYSFTQTVQMNPTVVRNEMNKYRGNLGYTYNKPTKYVEPFKKLIKNRNPWLTPIRDFNFNLKPSLLSFRADVNRQFGQYIPRVVNTDLSSSKVEKVDTTYDKYFKFDRFYNLRWDLSRSLNFDFKATNNAYVDEPDGALDTKAKRDTVRNNFFKGGRNIQYNQEAIFTYTIPINKLPMTDWITARYNYGTSFSWVAASRLAISIGNVLENSQRNNLTTELDFTRLYNKSRWLREVNRVSMSRPGVNNNAKPVTNAIANPKPANALGLTIRTRDEVIHDKDGKLLVGKVKKQALQKWRQQKRDLRTAERLKKANEPVEMSGFIRGVGKAITMVKRASINYTENYRSRVPGYMDSTQFLGENFKSNQPGLDYVFGRQPDTTWLNQKAALGVLSRDSSFNDFYRQNFQQTLSLTAQIEPVRQFIIDVNLDKSFSKEYSELFKDTINNNSGTKQHLSPYASGGFSVSYISFGTLFRSSNPNVVSSTFTQFENNRLIISSRVASANPYYTGVVGADGYAKGYGRYSQDVLIPAFLAAYSGKDPRTIGLINQDNGTIRKNPFSTILPKPNWRLTYTGLSKLPALSKIFTSITLTHSYKGELSMNNYTSALNYYDPLHLGAPQFIDTVSGNYVPFFLLPNITIKEEFGPLVGIDITTVSHLNVKFMYNKSRQLSLSLVDYQLSETNSSEIVVGGGYRIKGLRLPFKLPFMKNTKLDNDLSFKVDVGVRNDATSNSRLDQQNAYGTGGQRVVTIQPSIDYVLNKKINLKLFFDQRRVTPYISTSAPTINTRAGLSVRVSLAP